jgi:hypothetical protein
MPMPRWLKYNSQLTGFVRANNIANKGIKMVKLSVQAFQIVLEQIINLISSSFWLKERYV